MSISGLPPYAAMAHTAPIASTDPHTQTVMEEVVKFTSGKLDSQYFHYTMWNNTGIQVSQDVKNQLIALGYEIKEEADIDNGSSIYGPAASGWLDGIKLIVTKKPSA